MRAAAGTSHQTGVWDDQWRPCLPACLPHRRCSCAKPSHPSLHRCATAALQDLAGKAFCLCNLALRNRAVPLPVLRALRDRGLVGLNPLPPPFLLVRAGAEACVDVQISPDQRHALLDFHE